MFIQLLFRVATSEDYVLQPTDTPVLHLVNNAERSTVVKPRVRGLTRGRFICYHSSNNTGDLAIVQEVLRTTN
jgi:hypothetical protein